MTKTERRVSIVTEHICNGLTENKWTLKIYTDWIEDNYGNPSDIRTTYWLRHKTENKGVDKIQYCPFCGKDIIEVLPRPVSMGIKL